MNRHRGFNWQPAYVQPEAGEYPFSHPETRDGDGKVTNLRKGVYRVRVNITNNKITPTRAAQAIQNNIGKPDFLKV